MTAMHPCSGLMDRLAPPDSLEFLSEEYGKVYGQLKKLLDKISPLLEAERKAKEVKSAVASLASLVEPTTLQKMINQIVAAEVAAAPTEVKAYVPPPPTEADREIAEVVIGELCPDCAQTEDCPIPAGYYRGEMPPQWREDEVDGVRIPTCAEFDMGTPPAEEDDDIGFVESQLAFSPEDDRRDLAACVEENDCGDCRFDGYCKLQDHWREGEIFPEGKWIRVEGSGSPTCTAQEDRDEMVVSDPRNEGGELSLSVGARDIRIGGISEDVASTLTEWGSRRGLFKKRQTKWVAETLSVFALEEGATEEVAGQIVAKLEEMAVEPKPADKPKGGDVTAEPIALPLPARVRDVKITMGRQTITVEPVTAEAAAEIGNATVNARIAQRWNYEVMWSRLDMAWNPEACGTYPAIAQKEIMEAVGRVEGDAPTMAEKAAAWLREYKVREGKDCTTFELKKHFPLLDPDDLSGLGYAIDHGAIIPEGEELPPPPPDSPAVEKVKLYVLREGKVRLTALEKVFPDLQVGAIAEILENNDDFEIHDNCLLSPQELEAPFHQIRRFFIRGGTRSAALGTLRRVFPAFDERFGTTLGLLKMEPGFKIEEGTLYYTPEAEEGEEETPEPERVDLARRRIAEGFEQGNTIAFTVLEREVGEAALRHLERLKFIRITGDVKKTVRKGEAFSAPHQAA